MRPESDREEAIFQTAAQLTGAERSGFLKGICLNDPDLRRQLDVRLAIHDQPPVPLSPAQAEVIPTVISEAAPAEEVGLLVGRYKLLERLGEGGFGTVWLAEQKEPVRRKVALKIIKLGMDTRQVVARFEAERQALAMMDHPNIAKVLDAGTTEAGRPYFVMELVRGIPLTEFCDQEQMPTHARLETFIKVCQAVQHAHQKGIIHRDLKPSNILVASHDGVPVPKVIDFGIAKATQQDLTEKTIHTQFQQFVGTPAYMSPEQAEMSGLDVDTRSDIYSLGVLLYELLVGRTPFDAKELMASGIDAMRKTIREREPARPSTKLATLQGEELTTTAKRRSADGSKLLHLLKGDLDWIVMKCLEKDRTRRYETANGLAADLKRHLNNEPVVARPPSTAYRFQKAVRRNKLVFAAGAAVLLALIVGLGLAAAGLRQATKERNIALAAKAGEERQRREAQQAQANEARLRREAQEQALNERRRAYASDMNLAQQSIALNNFGRAQELLDRHRPASKSETDLRGWEWRYLWQFCQGDDLFTFCRQTNSAFSLAASKDARWLAIGEFDSDGISVWDLRTRRQIARPDDDRPRLATVRAAFSPREPLLAYSLSKETGASVQLWDASTQRTVGALTLEDICIALTFAEDGRSLAIFTDRPSSTISVWGIPDGKKRSQFSMDEVSPVSGQSRYSTTRDLRLAAYGMNNGRVRVVDLNTGKERWTVKAAKEWIMALTFSPDGKVLASSEGYAEGAIRLWEVESGKELARLDGHQGWVASLVFWPDGKKLASASADQSIRLWDVEDPARPHPLGILRGHNVEVWSLALLPDNVTLLSGGKDGSVRVWDTSKVQSVRPSTTLAEQVLGWRFAPDSKSVIGLDFSGRVLRWQGPLYQEAPRIMPFKFSGLEPSLVALTPDGGQAMVGSNDGIVQLLDLDHGTLLRKLSTRPGPARPLVFLPKDESVILRHGNNVVSEWNLATGREREIWKASAGINAWAISPDNRWFAAFAYRGTSIFWDRSTGKATPLAVNLAQASAANFSPDGQKLAVVSWLGIGKVWSTTSLQEVGTLSGFRQGLDSVVFSSDNSRIAVGSGGKEALKLYDAVNDQELLTLDAEGSNYRQTEFSPDGSFIGSRTGQGVLRLWRAPSWDEIAAAEAKSVTSAEVPVSPPHK